MGFSSTAEAAQGKDQVSKGNGCLDFGLTALAVVFATNRYLVGNLSLLTRLWAFDCYLCWGKSCLTFQQR